MFWYPSDTETKPTTALQITAGMEKGWGDDAYLASAEAYYRTTHNYHGFTLNAERGKTVDLRQAMLFGNERAFGGSVAVRKRFGELSGSLRYTLSWLHDAFAELNGGEAFASAFDRRHELEFWVTYSPALDWNVSCLCVLASEPPLTAETSPTNAAVVIEPGVTYGRGSNLDANGNKIPGFQRLEITVSKRASIWGVPCQFAVRMLNAYGLLDPYVWTLHAGEDPRRMLTVALKDLNLFPLYPSLGLTVRF